MSQSTPPIVLSQSVEQLITQICMEKSVTPPDAAAARRDLHSLDEQSAIEILKIIARTPKIKHSFTGFIRFLVDHKRSSTNNAVSPPKRVCTTNRSPATTPPPHPLTTFSPASPPTTGITTVRLMMSPPVKISDASSTTSSPSSTTTVPLMKPSRLPEILEREFDGRFSPQLVALGELEFRKQFLILNYLGGRSIQECISVEEIRELRDLPMIQFESAVWAKIGRFSLGVEQIKIFDWDSGKTHIYHCHVSLDGSCKFKGPFLSKERTFLQTALGDENVLLVKFAKDETYGKKQLGIDDYLAIYNWVSKDGILVGLRRYRLFVFKDGGKEERKRDPTSAGVKCYFVRMESEASIDKKREYILNGKTVCEARCVFMHLHTLPSMSKYMARLSLILSKTMKVNIDLASVNIKRIDDIFCRDADDNIVYDQDGERRMHTDGTGFISQDLAAYCPKNIVKGNRDDNVESSEIISRSSFEKAPLLIQFRLFYNGCAVKGTFLLNKELPLRTVMVRPSMIKVESDGSNTLTQNSFEVVSTSAPPKKTMNLSRNLIALLSYGGVPNKFFLKLVENAFDEEKTILTSRNTALRVALNNRQLDDLLPAHMLARGIPLDEPCLQYFMSIFMKKEKENMREGKIPIPECFNLMGTVDPTGKLEHDQVCIILENGQISGKVLVYRHPGLHFGDIHLLTATYVKDFENFVGNAKYAIFFPTKGPRSLADEMSGGDFDGDRFFVSRNPELLETFRESERWVQKSLKLKAPNKRPSDFLSEECLEEELFKQFLTLRFNPSYAVGEASDSWLAFIDRLLSLREKGLNSKEEKEEEACLKENINRLVDIHSDALDAPKKSGMKIEIPDELKAKVFPHYMEKEQRTPFTSTSVLGLIYDKVKKKVNEANELEKNIEIWKLPQFNQEFPEAYKIKWREHYATYRKEMSAALGGPKPDKEKSASMHEEKNAAIENIFRFYKQELYGAPEFEESEKSMDELYGEALAMYHIVYDYAKCCKDVGKCKFVWKVAGPVLLKLYASKQGETQILFTFSAIKELWG